MTRVVVAQMIFGFFGPQPHPTANFGLSNETGLSFPSYTVIFQNETDGIQKKAKNNYAQDTFSL